MADAEYKISVTAAGNGSHVGSANAAGFVHGGMGNSETTNYNQGSRSIVNEGQIGNIATGDNHSGNMTASVPGQQGAESKIDPEKLTPGGLIQVLKKRHCTDATIHIFETHKVDGRLFMELDDEFLDELGIDSKIERRKLKLLKEDING
ncbi:uncharacterized protein LOC124151574 [Haliotis rufescens]|uniref:uncharacterized protein LOC124151574 n=1 Tax=Haliotis rufescens TaxID=6454 RepID=UPI00201E9DA6|nr:uncharacterized protein LOC124151574 [Haliotis rufescens]